MNPKVSVILPAYNVEKYIADAVNSILLQSFGDFELLVIDDGSTDNTRGIVQSINDPRLLYLSNGRNAGLAFTLNKGIDQSSGQYIARMDGDDISLPDRFRKQVAYLDEHPEVSMV